MPVCFVLLGVFLISYLFGFVNKIKLLKSYVFLPITILILIGYFYGNIFVTNLSFNLFFALALFILIFYFILKKLISFYDVLISIILSLIYYSIACNNLSFLLTCRFASLIGLILILLSILKHNLSSCISFCLLSSLSISFVSAIVGYDNFGVFVIDLLFVVEVLVLSILAFILRELFYFRKGVDNFYVKENCVYNNSSCFVDFSFRF